MPQVDTEDRANTKRASRLAAVAAAAAAAAEGDHKAPSEVKLASGVLLGIKPVPPFLVRRAVMNLERPKPPKVPIPGQDREEENLNDPAYLEAKAAYVQATFDTGANVLLAAGTWVKELPDGVPGPESDEWLDLTDYFRVPVQLTCWRCDEASGEPRTAGECKGCQRARYLSWLSLFAITSEMEWVLVMLAVSTNSGISEEEVENAMASFRSGAVGGADSRLPPAAARDGHHVPEAAPEPSS